MDFWAVISAADENPLVGMDVWALAGAADGNLVANMEISLLVMELGLPDGFSSSGLRGMEGGKLAGSRLINLASNVLVKGSSLFLATPS